MTPLPLHGQVRPIKVEQQDTWNSIDSNEDQSAHNVSSTPPILRRRPRKRESDDHEFLQSPNMSFDMTGSLTSTPTHAVLGQQVTASTTSTSSSVGGLSNPTAQSTPLTTLVKQHNSVISGGGGHGHHGSSLLTTPTLLGCAGDEADGNSSHVSNMSTSSHHSHTTPKMQKFSPDRTNGHRTAGNSEAPRTPTPFKRALAEVYRAREPLSNTPQTPTKRVEDITEIIKKDMQQEFTDISFNRTSEHQMLQDSGYGGTEKRHSHASHALSMKHAGDKENSSPNKRGARKALASRWSTPASLSNMMFGSSGDQSMITPETPSKSLLGTDTSTSMLFSPPAILRETLPEAQNVNSLLECQGHSGQTDKSPPASKLDVRWNMIACGKTKPSLEMTEHARQYLSGIKPRSLNL